MQGVIGELFKNNIDKIEQIFIDLCDKKSSTKKIPRSKFAKFFKMLLIQCRTTVYRLPERKELIFEPDYEYYMTDMANEYGSKGNNLYTTIND